MRSSVLIVGAGSAGSVLAERLSTDPARRVTVMESGPGPDDPTVRALTGDARQLPIGPDSPVVAHYRSTLTGNPPRAADIVRGSCLGGSGAVNGCYFWPAPAQDFDALEGWSSSDVAEEFRAVGQRIPTSTVSEFSSGTEQFIHFAAASGYRSAVAAVPLNIAGGRRLGPGAVFLEPVLDRPNLSVLTGTRVTGVVFDRGRAVGVRALGPEGPREIAADRIVLAAGAIGSAQLLMLSGIGPVDALRALGIGLQADLPVGQHCWDHPELLIAAPWPSTDGGPVLEVVMNLDDLEIRPYTTGFGSKSAAIGVALMKPAARGRVYLDTTDPLAPPCIEHRYDSEPADVAALRRGCDIVADIIGDAAALGEPIWSTSQHLSGTAPIGAVVDPHCRVLGVDGLWVVDGSVLPTPLSRGPHATIAMIGHRAANFV